MIIFTVETITLDFFLLCSFTPTLLQIYYPFGTWANVIENYIVPRKSCTFLLPLKTGIWAKKKTPESEI